MTLIALLSVNGAPFLVGDVLLSADGTTDVEANLPLVGDINRVIADHGHSFQVSFTQKVNLIGEKLVVGWCGAEWQAKRALLALSVLERQKTNLDREDIAAELESLNLQEPLDQLQLIAFLLRSVQGQTVEGTRICWNVNAVETRNLGTVFVAGSGRDAFIALIEKADWTNSATGNEFQVAHALLGALTNEEYRTGSTIANKWGGGFEAVTFSLEDGRFKKVGDILHTFWTLRAGAEDSTVFLPMFYKTTYWRDALIIRSALFETTEGKFLLRKNDLNLIPPLLKDRSEYDLQELGGPVDFSHRALCCHVLIEKPDGRDVMLVIEQRSGVPLVDLNVRGDGAGRLHIEGELTSIIANEAKARLSTAGHASIAVAS